MSELKSRPPAKVAKNLDLEAFLTGAEKKTTVDALQQQKVSYPWEEQGVRDDVTKVYNLRLSEPYLLKLKYIAEHTPDSMQKFCLDVVTKAIDDKIEDLIK